MGLPRARTLTVTLTLSGEAVTGSLENSTSAGVTETWALITLFAAA